ncbi:MAG: hypothetical protein U5K99_00590 [Anaerolineales bacterium]|nr:hypothetical protein [Anaerolineales bacterium]
MLKKIRLLLRLLRDERVGPLLKLIPLLSLVYLILPDLIPGPIDDAVLIALLAEIFLTFVPKEVLEDNRRQIERDSSRQKREDIIDGEFWEEKKED